MKGYECQRRHNDAVGDGSGIARCARNISNSLRTGDGIAKRNFLCTVHNSACAGRTRALSLRCVSADAKKIPPGYHRASTHARDERGMRVTTPKDVKADKTHECATQAQAIVTTISLRHEHTGMIDFKTSAQR